MRRFLLYQLCKESINHPFNLQYPYNIIFWVVALAVLLVMVYFIAHMFMDDTPPGR